ncbi:tRNA (adenosine(37)-N6)-dimethylallyltransferase MiaA [Bacillus sp. HMF5848]|uniref:tRNA (adenosine(37)-N6)-dimethylallyltransferase MiaA n=1 Tax=Bacillus sp. HMF5848 TaxID=2495421 RepID=UPI0026CD943E|nr:tRNA (adenosine(37)-N6)-dimethylallyltransferase MiaA [Bacillus sp. HMF5848]
MEENKQKVIVIIGPTAVGKTKLSIEAAKRFNGEIISGDSMQVYRGMDIGTAKIKSNEMDGIPHHLLDIKDPTDAFSVQEFQELVVQKIDDITKRSKTPVIVGGTGLYIQSVLYDYQFSDVSSDDMLREELTALASQYSPEFLHNKLKDVDKESADRIHPNNTRRVIRALEIYHTTGRTMTEYLRENKQQPRYLTALIGLTMEREMLYERINQRVDIMLDEGLLEEVTALFNNRIDDCQSIQAIGYKELYDYLRGNISYERAVDLIKQNSRRYAKRQLTWFRNKMDVRWFDMTNALEFDEKMEEIFHYIAGKLLLKAK